MKDKYFSGVPSWENLIYLLNEYGNNEELSESNYNTPKDDVEILCHQEPDGTWVPDKDELDSKNLEEITEEK